MPKLAAVDNHDEPNGSFITIPTTMTQQAYDMTLETSQVVYLLPSISGAAPIPISIESRRRTRCPESNDKNLESVPETQQQHHQQQEEKAALYLLVGRQSMTSDIHIQHNSISRKHAMLYYDRNTGDCILQDLGSKYGTTINQHRISECTNILQHKDLIQFGNVRDNAFTVHVGDINCATAGVVPLHSKPSNELVKGNDTSATNDMNDDTERHSNLTSDSDNFQQQQQQELSELLEKAGEGLSGRAKHQAEIAAMMSTFDTAPTYSKVSVDSVSGGGGDGTSSLSFNNNDLHPMNIDTAAVSDNNSTDAVQYAMAVDTYRIPIANQIIIESDQERKKNVPTCIAIDPVGARFIMGSTDTMLRMFDFGGMAVSLRSFKSIVPEVGYWPVQCAYSNTGDRIIVGTGSVQPMVIDREGEAIVKFVRGDMYVTDQSKTFGHTAAVTGVDWHPFERDIVLTSSIDGSARLWNIHSGKKQFQMLVCDKVFQPKSSQGKRTTILCIAFHPSGREFAVGTSCGSIQIWNPSRASSRPERAIYNAHGDNAKRISALMYNFDGSKIATRSVDDTTVKVWNATKMSSSSVPIVTCKDANTIYEQANVAFSPDGKILCASVATHINTANDSNNQQRHETGGLHFYDISKTDLLCDPILTLDINVSNAGAILVEWHTKINQIFVVCSNGQIIVYYDPILSRKGAIGTSGKVRKSMDGLTALLRSRAPTGSAAVTGEIITPLYNPNLGHKRKRNDIVEEVHSLEPERPVSSKHKIGGVASGGSGLSFQQFIADANNNSSSKIIAGKDPREALFKYNEGKAFVDRAYKGNKSKLAEKTAEQEDEEAKQKKDFFNR